MHPYGPVLVATGPVRIILATNGWVFLSNGPPTENFPKKWSLEEFR